MKITPQLIVSSVVPLWMRDHKHNLSGWQECKYELVGQDSNFLSCSMWQGVWTHGWGRFSLEECCWKDFHKTFVSLSAVDIKNLV